MKAKVRIKSYSVLSNGLSVKLLSDSYPQGLIQEAKGEKKKVYLNDISLEAKIKSVNIQRDGANILLRTKKNRYLVLKLFELMGRESLELSFSGPSDAELKELLKNVSFLRERPEEEILFNMTTFRNKEGHEVPGKRNVEELTDLQKEILLRKLRQAVKNEKREKAGEVCYVS